jgi:hypothetical protein
LHNSWIRTPAEQRSQPEKKNDFSFHFWNVLDF